MSLDVYLTMPGAKGIHSGPSIFIRTVESLEDDETVFSYNITHNLNRMASEAGIYEHLWRPDEIGITKARQLIEPLKAGLESLVLDPDEFKEFNPPNGWGDYEGLVTFVRRYLYACEEYPDADVYASR